MGYVYNGSTNHTKDSMRFLQDCWTKWQTLKVCGCMCARNVCGRAYVRKRSHSSISHLFSISHHLNIAHSFVLKHAEAASPVVSKTDLFRLHQWLATALPLFSNDSFKMLTSFYIFG